MLKFNWKIENRAKVLVKTKRKTANNENFSSCWHVWSELLRREKDENSFVSLKKVSFEMGCCGWWHFNEDGKTWFYTNESVYAFLIPFMIHIFITFKVILILSTTLRHLAKEKREWKLKINIAFMQRMEDSMKRWVIL